MLKKSISGCIYCSALLFCVILSQMTNGVVFGANGIKDQNQVNSNSENYPNITILETTTEYIKLNFKSPKPNFESTHVNGIICEQISIDGLTNKESGEVPNLPVQGVMIGIPLEGEPVLKVNKSNSVILSSSTSLCPVVEFSYDKRSPGTKLNPIKSFSVIPIREANDFLPSDIVQIIETGMIRSQRYVQLLINPVQYNSSTKEIRYYPNIEIQINFNPITIRSLDSDYLLEEPFFENILKSVLINYEQSREWRQVSTFTAVREADGIDESLFYKIEVNENGFYEIYYEDLLNAGVSQQSLEEIDPQTFQVFDQSEELAIYVEGAENSAFEPGEYLMFYGEIANSKYSDSNIYWLTWGQQIGIRMIQIDGTPSGLGTIPEFYQTDTYLEEDNFYAPQFPTSGKDHWFWDEIYASSGPAYLDIPINLSNLSNLTHNAVISAQLKGADAEPYHHVRIYLNGDIIKDQYFTSKTELNITQIIQQSDLIDGLNTLRFECPHDGSIVFDDILLNWINVKYYGWFTAQDDMLQFSEDTFQEHDYQVEGFNSNTIEVFNITNPLAPEIIVGGDIQSSSGGFGITFAVDGIAGSKYLTQSATKRKSPIGILLDDPSTLMSTANGADYIIISHEEFINELDDLVALRESQGLRVIVIDVQDIYDEFNDGVISPDAIRAFLSYAYNNWVAPAPSFVLLVGDGHYDFKNIEDSDAINYIPPYLDDVDPWAGETATDNRYVSINGGDILPDMHIGRFPVRTVEEVQTMVQKTVNYELEPIIGDWNASLSFIADDADSGGSFDVEADKIAAYVTSSYQIQKIYYKINYSDIVTARNDIKSAINQGRLIIYYVGHAGPQSWANTLFRLSDISTLTNGQKLPIFIPMTCDEGYFIYPNVEDSSMGESVVKKDGGGAVASWSPTGQGTSSGHTILGSNFFDSLFNNYQNQVGYLTTYAKYRLYATSTIHNNLIETYILFGDPALRLKTTPVPLEPPTLLTAEVSVSSKQVNLYWHDNAISETEFRIERSLNGIDWHEIAVIEKDSEEYFDSNIIEGTQYYYRVRGFRLGDLVYSDYSNIAIASPNPKLIIYLPLIIN